MLYLITSFFVAFDMITGIIKAIKEKNFTSSVMREGLFHKCGSVALVVFGVMVDYAQRYVDIGVNIPIATAVCSYIILMEIGSITENIGKINPNIIPAKIQSHFDKLAKGGE